MRLRAWRKQDARRPGAILHDLIVVHAGRVVVLQRMERRSRRSLHVSR